MAASRSRSQPRWASSVQVTRAPSGVTVTTVSPVLKGGFAYSKTARLRRLGTTDTTKLPCYAGLGTTGAGKMPSCAGSRPNAVAVDGRQTRRKRCFLMNLIDATAIRNAQAPNHDRECNPRIHAQ